MIIFLIIIAVIVVFAIGVFCGFIAGKSVVQKNAVLDAVIDATVKEVQSTADIPGYSIEFYPLTKRYYPKYKNEYLKKEHATGIISAKETYLFEYCDYFSTEQDAKEFIELAKEHMFKKNVHKIVL